MVTLYSASGMISSHPKLHGEGHVFDYYIFDVVGNAAFMSLITLNKM